MWGVAPSIPRTAHLGPLPTAWGDGVSQQAVASRQLANEHFCVLILGCGGALTFTN